MNIASLVGARMPHLPANDPYFAQTILLSNAQSFDDLSPLAHGHASTNVSLSSAQSVFGGTSFFSDGTLGNILTYAASVTFGTGTFTLEFWAYNTGTGGTTRYLMAWSAANYTARNNTTGVYTFSGLTTVADSPAASANAWHHIVIQRNADGKIRAATDGVFSVLASEVTAVGVSGAFGIVNVPARTDLPPFQGYIGPFRLTNGVARYNIAGFTPPVAPFPIS